MDEKLKQQMKKYKNTPIPPELDNVVHQALKKKRKKSPWKMAWTAIAASIALFVGGLNVSPAFAHNLSNVPVVGEVIQLLTFAEYTLEEDGYHAHVKVPEVVNLENQELAAALNEKYIKENEVQYAQFIEEMKEMEKANGGHLGLDSGYQIVTDTDRIFSIQRYVIETKASATETLQYDTIDKVNQVLITLPSLFKNDRYVSIISENIKEQMEKEMKENVDKVYWTEEDEMTEPFQSIDPDQNFYINEQGKLVISFNEYEVAPGYMGTVEFVIPTHVIEELLVSNEYVY